MSLLFCHCAAAAAPATPCLQTDPEQAAMAGLKREVKLLRAENAFLREQLFQASLPREQPQGAAGAGAGPTGGTAMVSALLPGSRLPSSHGLLPGSDPGAGPAVHATAAGSRPASGGSASGGGAGAPSNEELMRRLLETQRMLVQFSRENDRLAGENGRLRSGKTAVANDYKGGPGVQRMLRMGRIMDKQRERANRMQARLACHWPNNVHTRQLLSLCPQPPTAACLHLLLRHCSSVRTFCPAASSCFSYHSSRGRLPRPLRRRPG